MKKRSVRPSEVKIEVLLRDLLITNLAAAGVRGGDIRRIVGCGMNHVTRVVKFIPEAKK
jgi:hypothetical protein